MRVIYRHVYTVVVEGHESFVDDVSMAKVQEYGDRDARLNTILVKHGGIDLKPVRSAVVTTTHFEVTKS